MPPFNVISSGRSINVYDLYTNYCESSISLEGDRGKYDYAIFPCHFKKVHTRNCSLIYKIKTTRKQR